MAGLFKHPSLAQNAEFWEKLSVLKKTDNRAIEDLIRQMAPEVLQTSTGAAQTIVSNTKEVFSLNKKAEKAREKLSKINQRHFDEFVQVLTEKGPKGLYEQPKRWHYEKLTDSKTLHTVRLDDGNRVLFEIKDGVAHILDIGNHITH